MMSLYSTEQFHEGLIIFPGMLMISLWYTEHLNQVMIWNVWLSLFKEDHRDYGQGDGKYDDPMHPYRVTGM